MPIYPILERNRVSIPSPSPQRDSLSEHSPNVPQGEVRSLLDRLRDSLGDIFGNSQETLNQQTSKAMSYMSDTTQQTLDTLNQSSEQAQNWLQARLQPILQPISMLKHTLSDILIVFVQKNAPHLLQDESFLNFWLYHPFLLLILVLLVLALLLSLLQILSQGLKPVWLFLFNIPVSILRALPIPFISQNKQEANSGKIRNAQERQARLLELGYRLEEIRLEENKILREIAKLLRE